MRLVLITLIISVLFACNSEDKSKKIRLKKEDPAEVINTPKEIDHYRLKGFGLLELDFSQMDFNLYSSPGFANKVISHLKIDKDQKILTDSLDTEIRVLFQNGSKYYLQVIDRQDEFHKVIIDEIFGTEVWIAPGPSRKFISWPVFLMERRNLKPVDGYGYYLEKGLKSDSIMQVPDDCYRAVQSSAEWLHLMKQESCSDKTLPKFLYLNWRKGDRRFVDFEF